MRLRAKLLCSLWLALACHSVALAQPALCEGDGRAGHKLTDAALHDLDIDKHRLQPWPDVFTDSKLRLGEVRFFRQNIFPHKNHTLARHANRFHTITKESALRAAFVLDAGSEVDARALREAERVLRDKPFLYDALILLRQVCAGTLDVDVVVRDVWTLTPGVGVSRSGGDNKTTVTLSDSNMLGLGKAASFEYIRDQDRSGVLLSYFDPNILNSRWQGRLIVADNDDGERYALRVGRPFYALDAPSSFGFSLDHFAREEDLEFLSDDLFELQAERDVADFHVGRSRRIGEDWVSRGQVGLRYVREQFEFPLGFPGPQSDTRRFAYPYVGWQLLQDQFVEKVDVNRVGIIEDIRLGWSSYVELGWAPNSFGNDSSTLLGRAQFDFNHYLTQRHLFSAAGTVASRYDLKTSSTEDLSLSARLAYLWQQADQWRMLASVDYRHTRALPLDKQLTLGGDTALRGYPSRYQPGDRAWLATLEQRYYSRSYPLGLFRVGVAVFVDVGRAWFADEAPAWVPARDGDHFDTLSNVGIGLRLESIRTRRDRVLHLDLAKPLVDGPEIDRWEFTITAKTSL